MDIEQFVDLNKIDNIVFQKFKHAINQQTFLNNKYSKIAIQFQLFYTFVFDVQVLNILIFFSQGTPEIKRIEVHL